MGPKINLKARIERHSRVLSEQKHNFSYRESSKNHFGYKLVSFAVVFLIPVYPVFASYVTSASETDFYRGDIDESSILSSYFGTGNTLSDGEIFIQSKDSFLYVNAPIDSERDVSGSSEIIDYEVKDGESIAFISQKFNVSKETIYWANGFAGDKIIHPGNIIKVPPVSGVVHKVKSGETLSGIAQEYDIDEQSIMRQNLLLSAADLKADSTIVIPGAKKIVPVPVVAAAKTAPTTSRPTGSSSSGGYSFATQAASEYVNTSGTYVLTPKPKYHTFYWGNCTWYVAKYKSVNWGGNANQWMRNAAAKGHATGSKPVLGSIIAFNGRGYNPYYGHVGIVMDIKSDHLIVSDMNYRSLGEVTTRKVPINDRSIQGYIYVD